MTMTMKQPTLPRFRVCVHCGDPLPVPMAGYYCERHGGRRMPDRGDPPPVTCAGCDRPLRPGSRPLCARCRGLAA